MSSRQPQPDPATRLLSHAIVGLLTGAAVGQKRGVGGFVLIAVLGAAAHEALDAPLAQLLTDLGT
jgi:hypothetical protein